jgi:hypothetical protein
MIKKLSKDFTFLLALACFIYPWGGEGGGKCWNPGMGGKFLEWGSFFPFIPNFSVCQV